MRGSRGGGTEERWDGGPEDRREYGRAWTALGHRTTGRGISVDVEGQHRVKARADPSRVKCRRKCRSDSCQGTPLVHRLNSDARARSTVHSALPTS